jgi:hypothetical protein
VENKPFPLRRVALIALLTFILIAPTLLLLRWQGWPYALIYLMGTACAAVLGNVLTNR